MRLLVRGPNGAGKSTLLKALSGDLALAAGRRVEDDRLRLGLFAQVGAAPCCYCKKTDLRALNDPSSPRYLAGLRVGTAVEHSSSMLVVRADVEHSLAFFCVYMP